jgi:hypothetical protein
MSGLVRHGMTIGQIVCSNHPIGVRFESAA